MPLRLPLVPRARALTLLLVLGATGPAVAQVTDEPAREPEATAPTEEAPAEAAPAEEAPAEEPEDLEGEEPSVSTEGDEVERSGVVEHVDDLEGLDEAVREEARGLFREGVRRADRGDWRHAVQRFRSALDLVQAPAVRYNLAESLARVGRLVEAQAELEILLAGPELEAEVARRSRRLDRAIGPRIGRLRIRIEGQVPADAQVTVDGRPVPPSDLDAPVPSDPGVRVVRLLVDVEEVDVEEVDVPPGGDAEVLLEAPRPATLAVDPIPLPTAPRSAPAPAPSAGPDLTWLAVLFAGLVVVGAAATVTGLLIEDGQGGPPTAFAPPILVFE
jgi:hypothetical protein